jgi:hypothetical protein
MRRTTKIVLAASVVAFFAVDHYHLWKDDDNFPFTSHGLFNHLFTPDVPLLRVRLHDSAGGTQLVDPGQAVPVEWYRASGLVENVFVNDGDRERQGALAALLLERLNTAPWPAFDEAHASARPPQGTHFVGLDVVRCHLDLRGHEAGAVVRPVKVEVVYSYRVGGGR